MRFASIPLLLVFAVLQSFAAGMSGPALAPEAQDYARLGEAVNLLQQGKVDDAYGMLDLISPRTPLYRYAFSEMQKIHYRRGEWDRFFGFAAFYRTRLLPTFIDSDLLLLESLALTKHCQFAAAGKVLAEARAFSQDAETLTHVQGVEDLLFLQSRIPGNVETSSVGAPFKAFSRVSEWKIPNATREPLLSVVVKNPRALRVYVRNLCKKGAQ